MRRLLAITSVVPLLAVQAVTDSSWIGTAAGQTSGCRAGPTADYVGCEGSGTVSIDSYGAESTPRAGSTSGPAKRYVPYERVSTNADGQPCITTGYREVPAGAGAAEEAILGLPDQDFGNILAQYPACPQQPGRVQETPAQIAARYWEEIPLPKPAPYIAPGWAITGKLAYLETNGELRHVHRNSTVVGPLEISATGTYYVDWGDGETTGPHSVEGKPWPEGEITHEYRWAGTYDILVTERWTASWRLGGQSGTLRELRTSGQIDDFRVTQIQAVIR